MNGDATIVGLGQPGAGDDEIGLVVARARAARGVPALESTDATILVSLLARGRRVVVVDAVVRGGDPGDVLHLRTDALDAGAAPVSSHGIGVVESIELAALLYGVDPLHLVDVVAVTIEAPSARRRGLSGAVARAIEPAAALAMSLARARGPRRQSP
jgi:hydrogenase maturation protease